MHLTLNLFIIITLNVHQNSFQKINNDQLLHSSNDIFLNFGTNKISKVGKTQLINSVFKSKIDVLGSVFRENIKAIKTGNQKVDLVFLIDASSSVGEENFQSEIKFVKKLLSDFSVSYDTSRVAVVTFSSQNSIVKNVDHISNPSPINNKCSLLNKELNAIKYTGGGTFTLGAFLVAQRILHNSRRDSKKVIFLITDGFSNGGDPVPVAKELKHEQVTIFTIGIRNGNYKELFELSTQPGQYYSYLLDSYHEFESLARRALHSDLHNGEYEDTKNHHLCDNLCEKNSKLSSCCDTNAICKCGLSSGQYSCICGPGYYGSGLYQSCHLCPNGTYADGYNLCKPCPDINHQTYIRPALNISYCQCKTGYQSTDDQKCAVITCPELKPPKHGYFVKQAECSNILHNACGVRCRVGYKLEGDSIRLCQNDATWSGKKPSCKIKTCAYLKPPKNGNMSCVDENNEEVGSKDKNKDAVPIDTRCHFKCHEGFALVGSKTRTCLPLSKWDGLNTSCRRLKCPRLPKISFGTYEPLSCATEKQMFGDNCTIRCSAGFKLAGPNMKVCDGKFGQWSNKNHTICEDITPPDLTCPKSINISSLPGKNYAYANWSQPFVTDNSKLNVTIWTKPAIENLTTFKFSIGNTTVTYVAIDAFKNKARCNFTVEVFDYEVPHIENCFDPPPFLSSDNFGANITWDEPTIFDNSQKDVQVLKSHEFGFFPIGTTQVKYTASDMFNNTNSCVLNITVKEAKCEPIPDPIFGKTTCKDSHEGVNCIITCQEGYAYEIDSNFEIFSSPRLGNVTDDSTELICHHNDPIWFNNDNQAFPDCSVTEIPKEIVQSGEVELEVDSNICKDNASLLDFENEISNNLQSNIDPLVCDDQVDCNVTAISSSCIDVAESEIEERTNLIEPKRSKRAVTSPAKGQRRTKINVKFTINGKVKEISKIRHVNFDKFKKIQSRIKGVNLLARRNVTLSKRFENALFYIDFKMEEIVALCWNGSVSKRGRCVKCPKGTFQNVTSHSCQSCPIGHFNDKIAQVTCQKCPPLFSTRRINAKSIDACKAHCGPGTFARKRVILPTKRYKRPTNINPVSLSPYCTSCPLNYYQPDHGQIECLPCPKNLVTLNYGSKSINDCLPNITSLCNNGTNICNNGTCVSEDGSSYYSCECKGDYIGSNCEIIFNSCASNPCLNNGKCTSRTVQENNATVADYICQCQPGFVGVNCEHVDDKCETRQCLNGGTCMNIDSDEICFCENKFSGENCEKYVTYCEPNLCENGGQCVELDDGFTCICTDGFIGKRCDLLPCDYQPCNDNELCVDLINENGPTTRENYRCECYPGYQGTNCTDQIDFCTATPCLNNGTCRSHTQYLNFTCDCPIPYTGSLCETKLDSRFVLKFPRSGTTDFVHISGPGKDLAEFSICLWVKTSDSINYGTMFSYATRKFDNTLTLTDYNGIVLYINDEFKVTDIYLNDGRWHFVCVTWQWIYGSFFIYVDGKLRSYGRNLGNSTTISGDGLFVLGQEQDDFGGKFSQTESFTGFMTNLDVWDYVLNQSDIFRLYKTCDEYYGNVYHWGQFKDRINGDVEVLSWPFCSTCAEPRAINRGKIEIDNNTATYSCRLGYILMLNGRKFERYSRKCDKTGQWEGVVEPKCIIVSCGYPGNVPNGFLQGTSYNYGDIVIYHCHENHELVGLKYRTCMEDGTWSYFVPFCLGVQCPAIEQPGNSIMTIFSEYQHDDLLLRNSYDVGTQIDFGCVQGTILIGDNLLTCQDNGTWDGNLPTCVENLEMANIPSTTEMTINFTNEISTENVNNSTESDRLSIDLEEKDKLNETVVPDSIQCLYSDLPIIPSSAYYAVDKNESNQLYSVGSKIEFKCRSGFQYDHEETSTSCLANSTWTNPEKFCKAITCKSPPKPKNMRLIQENHFVSRRSTEPLTFYAGNMVRYGCLDGYEGFGNDVIRCQPNGLWNRIGLRCARITCHKPIVPERTRIIGKSYLFEDTARIECPSNSNHDFIIVKCQANKKWTPEITC